jgi:hypothetical protein
METRKFEILLIFLSPEFVNSFPIKVWNSQRKKFFEKNRFSAILCSLFLPNHARIPRFSALACS